MSHNRIYTSHGNKAKCRVCGAEWSMFDGEFKQTKPFNGEDCSVKGFKTRLETGDYPKNRKGHPMTDKLRRDLQAEQRWWDAHRANSKGGVVGGGES